MNWLISWGEAIWELMKEDGFFRAFFPCVAIMIIMVSVAAHRDNRYQASLPPAQHSVCLGTTFLSTCYDVLSYEFANDMIHMTMRNGEIISAHKSQMVYARKVGNNGR